MLFPRVSLEGAIDLHVHTAPDIFPRYLDDVEAARMARAAGFAAILLKSHHESTVSRAIHTQAKIPGIRVFGGLVLNRSAGGLNPAAADVALRAGAKEIWMPTYDTEAHRKTFGSVGSYGLASMQATGADKTLERGLQITDDDGRLKPEVQDIVDLVAAHGAILGTAHVSPAEALALLEYTCTRSVKVVVTHPLFRVPDLSLELLQKVTERGGIAELVAVDHFNLPTDHHPTIHRARAAIDAIGAEHFILSSDAGQPFNPCPVEAIRVVAESLHETGLPLSSLHQMLVETPKWLLGLD